MINWKAGALLLAILVGLGAYAYLSRPKPTDTLGQFIPCDQTNGVYVKLEGAGKVMVMQRSAPTDRWLIVEPVTAQAEPTGAQFLIQSFHSLDPLNTIDHPEALPTYGLDSPREVATCRVGSGASYTLTIGKSSFDTSGYYAQKAGDSRVYVISSVQVDEFDRDLATPPVQPSQVPSGAPSTSPS